MMPLVHAEITSIYVNVRARARANRSMINPAAPGKHRISRVDRLVAAFDNPIRQEPALIIRVQLSAAAKCTFFIPSPPCPVRPGKRESVRLNLKWRARYEFGLGALSVLAGVSGVLIDRGRVATGVNHRINNR